MTTQLLHLDSSILGPYSVSRDLSAAVVKQLTEARGDIAVHYHDLAAEPIGHLSGAALAAATGGPDAAPNEALKADLAQGGAALSQFLAADIVVIGVGFYNFGIPSQLKAWIDRICVAGKTFRYGENGPEGLCGDKRVILAIARGGVYSSGPAAGFEHAETYLKSVFGFLGVGTIDVITAEGLSTGEEAKASAVAAAKQSIAALAA